MSQTIWAGRRRARRSASAAGRNRQLDPVGHDRRRCIASGRSPRDRQDDPADAVAAGEPLVDVRDRLGAAADVAASTAHWRLGGGAWTTPEHRRIIEEKLRSFEIPAKVVATNTGPVVTQYEVKPDARVKLSRIEALADDLAMALAARIDPDRGADPRPDVVGIEIPNHTSEIVGFRTLVEDDPDARRDEQADLRPRPRRVGQGRTRSTWRRCPTCSIAGATGSGKSVCVNALITSLLMRATPGRGAAHPGRPQARRAGAVRRACRTSLRT